MPRSTRRSFRALSFLVWILVLGSALPVLALGLAPSHGAVSGGPAKVVPGATPAAAVTLSIAGSDPSALALSWTQSSDLLFDHYEVDRSTQGAGGPWVALANISAANDTLHTVTGLFPGSTAWYQVVDYPTLQSGSPSNVISSTQPSTPTLSASNPTATSVHLQWGNGATYGGGISFGSYEVDEAVNGGTFATVATLSDPGTTSSTVSGLSSQTTYSFQVVTTDHCCGGSTLVFSSNTVTISTPTPLQVTASGVPTRVDVGQSVSFSCSASGGVGPYSFAWSFGDGSSGSGSNPSHAYSSGGSFTATCTGSDSSGATASAAVSVAVNSGLTVTITAPHPRAAPGVSLMFNVSASGGTGTYTTYSWAFGDGSTATGTNTNHAFSSDGTYSVKATVGDSNGALGSSTVTVTIQSVRVTPSVSTPSGQVGDTFVFSAAAQGGSGSPYQFRWTFGDGSSGSGAPVSHSFGAPGTYTITVTATDPLGATGSGSLSALHVYASLNATIQASSPDPAPNQVITLTAAVSGGSGRYSCAWNFGGSLVLTGCSVQHSWPSTGRYKIGLTVTDPSAGNTSTVLPITVGDPTTIPPGPTVSGGGVGRYWVFAFLAIPAVLILWKLTRPGPEGNPPATDPRPRTPRPGGSPNGPRCATCGALAAPGAVACPQCERPLPASARPPLASNPPSTKVRSPATPRARENSEAPVSPSGRSPMATGTYRTGAVGPSTNPLAHRCPTCQELYAPGALYCLRCRRALPESARSPRSPQDWPWLLEWAKGQVGALTLNRPPNGGMVSGTPTWPKDAVPPPEWGRATLFGRLMRPPAPAPRIPAGAWGVRGDRERPGPGPPGFRDPRAPRGL